MDADKNCAALSIGDGDPAIKSNEGIIGAGHHRAQSGVRQISPKPARHIEGDAFLGDDVRRDAPSVKPAMPRIDDYGRERCRPRCTACQEKDSEGDQERCSPEW